MKPVPVTGEHEFEPVEGLPETPPEDERILWQGRPSWRGLALRVFHVRKIAIYFAILLAWRGITVVYDGGTYGEALTAVGIILPIAALGVALLAGMAWAYAKTTVYTVTSRRVVMRFGLALTLTVNLPFKHLRSADMKICGDGTGDLPLDFGGEYRLGYIHMWPFVRPWKLARPQPMLRAVRNPEKVAEILVGALNGQPVRAVEVQTERRMPDAMPAPAE